MIIGIGGASRSGKSFLSDVISSFFLNKEVVVLRLDDYTLPKEELPTIRNHIDWEIPDAYDFEKMKTDILQLSSTCDILIAEGFLIYYDPAITDLFDIKLFVTISKETFMLRKSEDHRWGIEPVWYRKYIWSCYLKYGIPNNLDSFHVLSGEEKPNMDEVKRILT